MKLLSFKQSLIALAVLAPFSIIANDEVNTDTTENEVYVERLQILGDNDSLRKEAGSATYIGEAELEKFKFDDINRVLYSVPGVNIREEDGYGLRPNIGFRGTTPERSKKITVMEDGVLIGPAPYSAPAAYYFPMMNKMTSLEVFKGPAATKYGPNTVAGALNMTTRQVPDDLEGRVDFALGSDGYQKAKGYFGDKIDNFSYLIEGVNISADGFKELDGGGDTGFDKNDIMAKLRYDLNGSNYQQLFELKLAYSDEISDETYLGLTDEDFDKAPNRRYAASQLDKMDWEHSQVQLTHFWGNDTFDITTRAYRNNFERSWFKINGFKSFGGNSADLQDILATPEENLDYYLILTGQMDSIQEHEKIILGDNAREYYSQGIQTEFYLDQTFWNIKHTFNGGVRFHQDQIERNHTEDTFWMRSAELASDGTDTVATTTNREKTDAISVFIQDTMTLNDLEVTIGLRGEFIDSTYQNRALGKETDWLKKSSQIYLPSFSAFYSLSEHAGILFGVHEGFIPTSPKENPDVEIENSINYEFGGRYKNGSEQLEAVVFFNDIKNLKESCSFSQASSCSDNLDAEYGAGEVDVYGLELTGSTIFETGLSFDIPVSIVYTYTDSEFKTSFDSGFPMWGVIEAGDQLPYLAENQLSFNVGLSASDWDVSLVTRFIDEMLEASGDGEVLSGEVTQSYWIMDLSASYDFDDYGIIYIKVDNLMDEQEIISRRPYGARPTKPQQFQVGYQYSF
jgi:Fe(3+) dicitrate transport protein